ncbi:MAG: hypothetical protein ACHQ15_06725, partial [Candidatus Limnocylindrales bacterium]
MATRRDGGRLTVPAEASPDDLLNPWDADAPGSPGPLAPSEPADFAAWFAAVPVATTTDGAGTPGAVARPSPSSAVAREALARDIVARLNPE